MLVLRGEPGRNYDMMSEDETSADLTDSHMTPSKTQHKYCKPLGYSSLVLRTSQWGSCVALEDREVGRCDLHQRQD